MSTAGGPPLYILAGGQSRRFGSDKARALVEGKPLVVRVAEALSPKLGSATVVARGAGQYKDLGLTTIADRVGGLGPMGGVSSALQHRLTTHGPGWTTLASCDWVNVDVDLLQPLLDALNRLNGEGLAESTQAIAYRAERWEPMPGLYHTSLLSRVEDQLQQTSRALWRLLDQAEARAVAMSLAPEELYQANTPAALESFVPKSKTDGRDRV